MKSIVIKLLIALSIFFIGINYSLADWTDWIKVIVTEKVPWANCTEKKEWDQTFYECSVAKWFTSVTIMLWKMIKYFTYLAALWWVLFLVVNWILYSMWWMDQWMKDEAKKRIEATLIWLVILLLSWVILNFIAPWIYK